MIVIIENKIKIFSNRLRRKHVKVFFAAHDVDLASCHGLVLQTNAIILLTVTLNLR